MTFPSDENVIVGLDRADDAGVYQISDDLALIQTVDFFTPIVDDPHWFGHIAAANALSDVYAMGGTPKTAMNLVAFPARQMDLIILLMAVLNRDAAKIMSNFNISACTDVTGFGLLGHLAEMVCGSGTSVRIDSGLVPVIAEALEFASMGLIPAGAHKNREFREDMIAFAETVPRALQDVLFDPQTSGGLLISVSENQADALVSTLKDQGNSDAAQIGEIIGGPEEHIRVV